jgi:hypothetical protein
VLPIPVLGKWQGALLSVLGALLLLLGVWLHGRHAGAEAERENAKDRLLQETRTMIEHQAEVAKTMGAAVRSAYERENVAIDQAAALRRKLHNSDAWREQQIAGSDACAAWAAAPVACRLRPVGADDR